MVATEMGKKGLDALKEQGIDLMANVIPVEKSVEGMKNIVSTTRDLE